MESCIYYSGSRICIWKVEHTSGGLRELGVEVLAVWVLLAAGSQWAPFIYTARGLLNLLVCRPVVNVCSLQLNYGCYETVCKEFMATEVLNIPNIAVWTEGSLSLKGPGPDIYSEFGMNQHQVLKKAVSREDGWRPLWARLVVCASWRMNVKWPSRLLGSSDSYFSWTETP